jgi:hypothetical protein
MAAKKPAAAKPAASTPAPTSQPASEARSRPQVASFDGFNGEEVNVPDIDGWYSPEQGEAGWVGRIVGEFRMKGDDDRERTVVVVRLASDCSSASNEGEPVILEAGQVMAVSIRAKLVGLLDYVERRAMVAVRAIGKKEIGKGRSMWVFTIKGQPGARVPRQDTSGSQGRPQDLVGSSDNLGF